MSKTNVICVVPVKNEAWILKNLIECAQTWADLIIIGDRDSWDDSVRIAQNYEKVKLIHSYRAGFVINSAFYRWGHKCMYDGELLELGLREAGFINIKRCVVGQSDDENLRCIEMHGQFGNYEEEMNIFETMVFEAKYPECGICKTSAGCAK